MPICQKCGKKWTWHQTIKTLFKLKCPYCDTKQYESASSRVRSGMLMYIPFGVIFLINILLDVSIGLGIFIVMVLFTSMFALYPFILTLSNEREPLW